MKNWIDALLVKKSQLSWISFFHIRVAEKVSSSQNDSREIECYSKNFVIDSQIAITIQLARQRLGRVQPFDLVVRDQFLLQFRVISVRHFFQLVFRLFHNCFFVFFVRQTVLESAPAHRAFEPASIHRLIRPHRRIHRRVHRQIHRLERAHVRFFHYIFELVDLDVVDAEKILGWILDSFFVANIFDDLFHFFREIDVFYFFNFIERLDTQLVDLVSEQQSVVVVNQKIVQRLFVVQPASGQIQREEIVAQVHITVRVFF